MDDTLLTSSLMLAKTPPDEVLVSETTYRMASRLFEWEFEDDVSLTAERWPSRSG